MGIVVGRETSRGAVQHQSVSLGDGAEECELLRTWRISIAGNGSGVGLSKKAPNRKMEKEWIMNKKSSRKKG
jgi:hypothetical protein